MSFSVVVADPPWRFSDKLRMSKVKRGAAANYSTMSTAALSSLPVIDLMARDAVIALWCPSSLFPSGLWVLERWGFDFKSIYSWGKTNANATGLAFGMGHSFRACTEHALIGTRGRPKRLNASQRNLEMSPALPHSMKPETLQDRLEKMYAGPGLELFARRDRGGSFWTCVGNECPSTRGEDVRISVDRLIGEAYVETKMLEVRGEISSDR